METTSWSSLKKMVTASLEPLTAETKCVYCAICMFDKKIHTLGVFFHHKDTSFTHAQPRDLSNSS